MDSCLALRPPLFLRARWALQSALARFAALPASDRAEMGRRGRARMERLFSKRAVVAETIQHLGIVHD